MEHATETKGGVIRPKNGQLVLFSIEGLFAGLALALVASGVLPRILSTAPRYIVAGIALFAIGLISVPFEAAYARSLGVEFSIAKRLLYAAAGAVVGASLFLMLAPR